MATPTARAVAPEQAAILLLAARGREPNRLFSVQPGILHAAKDHALVIRRLAWLSLGALAILDLAACTHYRYIFPETEAGRQCVATLDARVHDCEQRAEESSRGQRVIYDAQMIAYRACVQQAVPSAQMPQPCAGAEPVDPGAAQRNSCRQNYQQSFIDCGGRLEEVRDN